MWPSSWTRLFGTFVLGSDLTHERETGRYYVCPDNLKQPHLLWLPVGTGRCKGLSKQASPVQTRYAAPGLIPDDLQDVPDIQRGRELFRYPEDIMKTLFARDSCHESVMGSGILVEH